MADETTGNAQAPQAVSTPSPEVPDDFALSLKEFDEANQQVETTPPPAVAPDPQQQIEQTREQIDAVRQLGELRQWALGVEGERLSRREREESELIFARGQEMVADFDHLPADFSERWLRAEYSIDPELHHAWDNRHESEDDMRRCRSCLRRALHRLRKAATQVPDAEATATKALIEAAMFRGGRKPPPMGVPDYSKMTDAQFREAVKAEHGFNPI